MSIWAILGIEQTYDTAVIRRAYAKELQNNHPEDDPAGYQRLREAYDQAMKLAKQHQQSQSSRAGEEEEDFSSSSSEQSFGEVENEVENEDEPWDKEEDQDEDRSWSSEDEDEDEDNLLEDEDGPWSDGDVDEDDLLEDEEESWSGEDEDDLLEDEEDEPWSREDQGIPRIPRLPKWGALDSVSAPSEDSEVNRWDYNEANDYGWNEEDEDAPEDLDDGDKEPAYSIDTFMEHVHALYQDFPARLNLQLWVELLGSDILWDIDAHREISDRMLDFCEQHYFLPREVWHLLEDAFRWRERSAEEEDFAEEYPKIYAYAIVDFSGLHMDYSSLLQAEELKDSLRDDFLRYREAAALALQEDDRRSAHMNLIKALNIFKSDKDLIRLQTEFYRRTGDQESALASCNELIRIDPADSEALLLRARLLLGIDKASEAMEDVRQILNLTPKHAEALTLAGQCYMKLGKLDQAKNAFNQVLTIDEEEIEAVLGLAEICRRTEMSLHQLQGPARRHAKREINAVLGRTPLLGRLKRAAGLLLSRRWAVMVIIVVLHLMIGGATLKHTGESPWTYAYKRLLPPKVLTVQDAALLGALPEGNHAVRMKLTKAEYIDVLEIEDEDAKSPSYRYMRAEEAKKLGLMDQISGYVCIGYVGNASVIFIGNYDQAMEAYRDKTVNIAGRMKLNPPEQLQSAIKHWTENPWVSQNYLSSHPLSEYYVIAKDGIRRSDSVAKLPASVPFLTILLILFYIPFIQEVRRQWRYLRYN
ncbi:J domain-containing protein [Paenibacillus ihumii]|uniref:J domain-containing protein n=1 Tax=Paenibacillus ihumii TaxID=687436 RepID=UPI0006D7A75E|nr:tetratricopeptide repeat protein [Paenibacillus ihumii]